MVQKAMQIVITITKNHDKNMEMDHMIVDRFNAIYFQFGLICNAIYLRETIKKVIKPGFQMYVKDNG